MEQVFNKYFPKHSSCEVLAELVHEGAHRLYGEITKDIQNRITFELTSIKEKGVAQDFLIIQDLVKIAIEADAAPHLCKGVINSSIISYCLGITDIDPLKYGLLFERFLNEPANEYNIDLRLSFDKIVDVYNQIIVRYGEDNVNQIDFLAWTFRVGDFIVFIVGDMQMSIDSEMLFLLKNTYGKEVDIQNFPLNDVETFKLINSGKTRDIYYLEDANLQLYRKDFQLTKFEELAAFIALDRPIVENRITQYIARKNGIEIITYPIAEMEGVLKETYGLLVYNEQLMLLAQILADFSPGESNRLRRAMGKKMAVKLEEFKHKFISQGKVKGYSEIALEQVWDMMYNDSVYLISKSTVIKDTKISYIEAFVKTHYPLEFENALIKCIIGG